MAGIFTDALLGPENASSLPGPEGPQQSQLLLLDFFFPGFSVISSAVQKYLHLDLNIYIPTVLLCGALSLAWRYFSDYFWDQVDAYLMSTVEIRTDDEIYNILMSWVAKQNFSQRSRRFIVNTNLSSRSWYLWRWDWEEDDDLDEDDDPSSKRKKKPLSYTPAFGSHYFWYRSRLLLFRRRENREGNGFLVASEREEISVSCFGRNPWILKELLLEARTEYQKKDERNTLIYRGNTKVQTAEPVWQRCMARIARPFSTVILNEKVKQDLIDDVTDYLNPSTRRWYANRGIPYRRGYLLYGPPGTGKSSLSLALAGYFKMRIYIASLNSPKANEENLTTLFADLPRRCVVLLEDIDTAGLTHTRDNNKPAKGLENAEEMTPSQVTPGNDDGDNKGDSSGKLSLSGLLNILDGVASQEGRILIMTTNHLEKLDKALIRPGRVDMIVEFGNADQGMTKAIYKAIYAPLDADASPIVRAKAHADKGLLSPEEEEAVAAKEAAEKDEVLGRIDKLADDFSAKIPAHEFSPAELQGYLLKHKRDPDAALAKAEQWVDDTRREKKEKELKEAEEKRQAEAKKLAEAKAKEEENRKKEEEETGKKTRKQRKRKSKKTESSDSEPSASESEEDKKKPTQTVAVKEKHKQEDKGGKKGQTSETSADEAKHDSGYEA